MVAICCLKLLRGDLHALPYADNAIDTIWSVHTFSFWTNPEVVSAELLRILAPGGRIVVTLVTGTMSLLGDGTFWPLHQQAAASPAETATSPAQRRGWTKTARRGLRARPAATVCGRFHATESETR